MSHDRPSPAPWYTDLEHEHLMVFGSDKIAVADCAPYYASPYQAVCEANARLITAAPDLLEALRECLPYAEASVGIPETLWPNDSCLLKARAAIAKAEGQT